MITTLNRNIIVHGIILFLNFYLMQHVAISLEGDFASVEEAQKIISRVLRMAKKYSLLATHVEQGVQQTFQVAKKPLYPDNSNETLNQALPNSPEQSNN